MCTKPLFQQTLHAQLDFLENSNLPKGGIPVNYFIIHLSYRKGYFKISKIYLLRSDAQTLELLLTSVMLSSFNIFFFYCDTYTYLSCLYQGHSSVDTALLTLYHLLPLGGASNYTRYS